ncbi:Altronate dehydratase [Blautia producta]|uniref:Altronate dehydratase n=1 Tax=Blautia producta TaxID=33035 RepID=A0A4P6M1U6_9FIRM|nr:altronate dehydratase family protein [Blautia producta]QBE97463.1 Altronate dehydratase [Blautia producta]
MQTYLKIHPDDSAAVALAPLTKGTSVHLDNKELLLSEDIPQGHKFALKDIRAGETVIKYGSPIGLAKESIAAGSWIHTHNMKTGLGELLTYTYHKKASELPPTKERFFNGYRRSNGQVGVRNEIWIIPTVGCVNNVASAIEKQAQIYKTGTIDHIAAFPHPYGCSQMGDDQEHTRRILADLINHPNAGGVLVLGLGCENSNIGEMKKYIGPYDPKRVRFLAAQESEDEIEDGLAMIRELAEYAGSFSREPVSCRELVIGMKCGGSDGLSGITANPTVGGFSDLLISKGGTTILTEVPEMFGAETLLMNRCADEKLFDKTVDLINDFKNYFKSHNQTIYENPSPGNKKGGISTLEDKSMGCTQKSGSAPVKGVLSYGELVKEKGLNLLSAPGNDLVASTALAASGAHIVLFTTGRGTPFASPVPTVKISSNSALFEKKRNWIDFDCGPMTEGVALEELSSQLFEYVLRVASGEKVKAEEAGFHDMAIFKQGVTL